MINNNYKAQAVTFLKGFIIVVSCVFSFFLITAANNGGDFFLLSIFSAGLLSFVGAFVLVIKKKYTIAKFIIVIIPPYILMAASVYAKSHDIFSSTFTYLIPRMFMITYVLAPVISFGIRLKKQLYISILIISPTILFFDFFHGLVGIELEHLPYEHNIYPVFVGFVSLFFMIAASGTLIFQNETIKYRKKLSDQNLKLDTTLSELNDSIKYATDLQNSLLPNKETLNQYFDDNAVIFLPKSNVSGDFYFVHTLNEYCYFGIGDCTGHGIPGAFIASMSIEAVKTVIHENKGKTPDVLLENLREIAKKRFETNINNQRLDSMDAGVCLYQKEENKLYFSGGGINLLILRNFTEIIEYKASKCPVGKYPIEKPYICYDIDLQKNDIVYLASDGLTDQFGREKDTQREKPEKYKIRRFKELILSICHLPCEEQKEAITCVFQDWSKEIEQIDDITVFIVKHS